MSQEIEIEKKNLLTKEEFEKLVAVFQLQEQDFVKQTNHYFETDQFVLRSKHSALRIREKNGQVTLTLKQPHPDGLLETHQHITIDECKNIMENGFLPDGEVKKELTKLLVPAVKLQFIGSLSTSRAEFPYKTGLVALDKSTYLGVSDYEIELEGRSKEEVNLLFQTILTENHIKERSTKNKIVRFFERKNELNMKK